MKWKTVLFLIAFFIALLIASNYNLYLLNAEERYQFADIYYSWLIHVGKNIGSITANVVKLEWIPSEINNTLP
jgi:hypothetical protein